MRIEANNVEFSLDGRTILHNESVICEPGAMTALVGPSGSGKTTLLNCLGLLIKPTGGHVLVDGTEVTEYTAKQRRSFWRRSAAFVLQDYGIIDDETLGFNITLSFRWKRLANSDQALNAALWRTGLQDRVSELASHLSGGEKQRLAIARAIYKKASVLLVDEPTASLDAANRQLVIDLFREMAAGGATVIIATHDDEMIAACDRRHLMNSSAAYAANSE
jgi:putative ABC transport system ATP-binding protein